MARYSRRTVLRRCGDRYRLISTSININPQRGEIWRVELDPVRGSEQVKQRPVVVLNEPNVGRLSIRICVPVIHRLPIHSKLFWCTQLRPTVSSGLTKISSADSAQIRALDLVRFTSKLGVVTAFELDAIAAAVAACAGYKQ